MKKKQLLSAPNDPSQRIDLDDDEEIDDEGDHPEALPRPLTATTVQTGSTPSQSSKKRRGKKAGKFHQQKKAARAWSDDFRKIIAFLQEQTRRKSFTLRLIHHSEATFYQKQCVSLFDELKRRLADNQLCILLARVFIDYRKYAEVNGYRGGGYPEYVQIKANNQVANFAEVFGRASLTPWIDPCLAKFGQTYTPPRAASADDGAASGAPASTAVGATPKPVVLTPASKVGSASARPPKVGSALKPTEPNHPPPGWKPTLFREEPADGAAPSAPDVSKASAAAGGPSETARTVHLAPDPEPASPTVKIPVPREQVVASIVEAVARGYQGEPIPPPPVAPPAPIAVNPTGEIAPVPTYPPPPKDPPPSTGPTPEQEDAEALAEAIRVSLEANPKANAVVVVIPASQTSPRERPAKRTAESEADGAAPERPPQPEPAASSRGRVQSTGTRGLPTGRSRSAAPVSQRPVILRPRVPGFPQVRVQGGETWFRGGAQNFVPHIAPYPPLGPRPFGPIVPPPATPGDPYDLPQYVWQDPSLYRLGASRRDRCSPC